MSLLPTAPSFPYTLYIQNSHHTHPILWQLPHQQEEPIQWLHQAGSNHSAFPAPGSESKWKGYWARRAVLMPSFTLDSFRMWKKIQVTSSRPHRLASSSACASTEAGAMALGILHQHGTALPSCFPSHFIVIDCDSEKSGGETACTVLYLFYFFKKWYTFATCFPGLRKKTLMKQPRLNSLAPHVSRIPCPPAAWTWSQRGMRLSLGEQRWGRNQRLAPLIATCCIKWTSYFPNFPWGGNCKLIKAPSLRVIGSKATISAFTRLAARGPWGFWL